MPGICCFFEDYDIDVYSGRTIDLDAWNYALKAGGPDMNTLFVINRTNQKLLTPDANINFITIYGDHKQPSLPGKAVYFLPPGDKRITNTIWNFNHKTDWYCFGPAQEWEFTVGLEDSVATVPIPVLLHATHIASIVMCHRYAVINGLV